MIKEKDDGSLRALMSNCDFEADALEDSDDDGQSVGSDDFLNDMEEDPTSNVADCKFSAG